MALVVLAYMSRGAKAAGRAGHPFVSGPDGGRLYLDDLPPPDTVRWVARRKAEVVAAIHGNLITRAEACRRYRLSEEELLSWEHAAACAGVPGLRVTRVQIYRPVFAAGPAGSALSQVHTPRRN